LAAGRESLCRVVTLATGARPKARTMGSWYCHESSPTKGQSGCQAELSLPDWYREARVTIRLWDILVGERRREEIGPIEIDPIVASDAFQLLLACGVGHL
jgi:hypothetical protein